MTVPMLKLPGEIVDLDGWSHPRPSGMPVDDPTHCPECARLADRLAAPWYELAGAAYAGTRASLLFLNPDAFAHYAPGFLAAAACDYYWGRDLYERVVSTLAYSSGHTAAIREDDWRLLVDAIRSVGRARDWLSDGDLVSRIARAECRRVERPEDRGWHWLGELRGHIEAAFPASVVTPSSLLLGDPEALGSTRRPYAGFSERSWADQPVWSTAYDYDALYYLRVEAFPAVLPAYLWAVLEPGLSSNLELSLGGIATRAHASRAEHWRALTPDQRRAVGSVLLRLGPSFVQIGHRWIADAEDAG